MKNLLLDNPFFKAPVVYFDHVVSTMDTAAASAGQEYPSGTVIMAGYQTNGRGRGSGRTWEAAPGSSILCTLLIRTGDCSVPAHQIPVRTGLGICAWMASEWKLPVELKWPNDVLVEGKKICGILCEASAGWTRIGFGINLNQEHMPEFTDTGIRATSVRLESRSNELIEPARALEGLLPFLYAELAAKMPAFDDWTVRANALLYKRNCPVMVRKGASDNPEVTEAVVIGVNSDGALLIRESAGNESALYSGEITYR